MKVAVLDEKLTNSEIIAAHIRTEHPTWRVSSYETSFSFVTDVYDKYKGDLDCIWIYLSDDKCERIRMARDIQDFFPHIRLVFYAESENYASRIFNALPSFFITLPLDKDKIASAFERVGNLLVSDYKNSLQFNYGGKYYRIRFEYIEYVECYGRKLIINTTMGSFETYMKMDEIIGKLPDSFMRCHRSYIVNTDMIDSIKNDGVSLLNKYFIPVSRQSMKSIKEKVEGVI